MATLGLDRSQFNASVAAAKGEAYSAGSAIGGALSSALGSALSIGALGMAFNAILQKVADIKSEAIQTGFDTDSIQKFNFALGQMNIEVQSGKVGLGIMNKLIGEASEGEKHAVEIFSRWGISTSGKSNAEIFEEIRSAISAMPDPANRVAMAMEIFGRGGRELLPYLTASKEMLDEMAAHAPIISKEDIDSIDQAKQRLEEVKNLLLTLGAKAIGKVAEAGTTIGQAAGAPSLEGDNPLSFLHRKVVLSQHGIPTLSAPAGEQSIKEAAPSVKEMTDLKKKHAKEKAALASKAYDAYLGMDQGNPLIAPGKFLGPKPALSKKDELLKNIGPSGTESLTAMMAMSVKVGKDIPEKKEKESPGESHRIGRMMETNSMQKIGAYAAQPPGYMEMVKASLSTEKHLASIDKKIIASSGQPTRFG
jgi:uncharacterized phage infection (PIP) family protein YhgE